MKKTSDYRVLKYFFTIIFPIVIILGNFEYLAKNESFYFSLYKKSGVYHNFERENVVENSTRNLLGYFRGKNRLDNNFYSEQAVFHLNDVKTLLQLSSRLFILASITCLLIGMYLIFKKRNRDLFNALLAGSMFTLISIILLGFGLLKAFDWLFIKFHLLLFSNNLWMFEESDNLIKLFPQEFFINFANQLAINILISSALIAVTVFVLKNKLKPNSQLTSNT